METTPNINMAEFFEPRKLSELVIGLPNSRQHIEALVNGIIPFPSAKTGICLYGPYGSGKTAAAKALPAIFESAGKLRPTAMAGKQLYPNPDYVTELGCTSLSLPELTEAVRKPASIHGRFSGSGYRWLILNEFDQLTPHAQAGMKALMEEKGNFTLFILTTNIRNIDGGVISRSHMIEMAPPLPVVLVPRGRDVLRMCGVPDADVPDAQILNLAHRSGGDFRDFIDAIVGLGEMYGKVPL